MQMIPGMWVFGVFDVLGVFESFSCAFSACARLFYESETEDGDVAWWPTFSAGIILEYVGSVGSTIDCRAGSGSWHS